MCTVARAGIVSLFAVAIPAGAASARTVFDGAWSLTIATTRGQCSTYNFPARITNGRVSFPGLVRANGRVTPKGAVRVTVAAGDKVAWGSGRLNSYLRRRSLERPLGQRPLLGRLVGAARLSAPQPKQRSRWAGLWMFRKPRGGTCRYM